MPDSSFSSSFSSSPSSYRVCEPLYVVIGRLFPHNTEKESMSITVTMESSYESSYEASVQVIDLNSDSRELSTSLGDRVRDFEMKRSLW